MSYTETAPASFIGRGTTERARILLHIMCKLSIVCWIYLFHCGLTIMTIIAGITELNDVQ